MTRCVSRNVTSRNPSAQSSIRSTCSASSCDHEVMSRRRRNWANSIRSSRVNPISSARWNSLRRRVSKDPVGIGFIPVA